MDFILGSRITFGDRQTCFYRHLTFDYRHLTFDYRHLTFDYRLLRNSDQLFYGCDCDIACSDACGGTTACDTMGERAIRAHTNRHRHHHSTLLRDRSRP